MKLSFQEWADALAKVESNNDPNVKLGDGGRAAGRWQMHPSFVQEWGRVIWSNGWTWDQVFFNALGTFYIRASNEGVGDVEAAVGFHLHGQPRASAADLASADGAQYAKRFKAAAGL